MSLLRKLTIQGIRAFNPRPHDDQPEHIEFFTPMTLILGKNGCGKTTILEACKYAITNKFPDGSDHGRAFVTDPKLCNTYHSLGVAKLEFSDEKGNIYCINRRAKVTTADIATGKLRLESKDATLKKRDPVTKREEELSAKCFDLTSEITNILGVSESILNNVIFCHQEDSCWPLDEPKKVKEKFDSIFNTTVYIKSLEHLVKQEKKIFNQLKIVTERLKHLVINKDISLQKKQQLGELEANLCSDMDEKEQQSLMLAELNEKNQKLEELLSKFDDTRSRVNQYRSKIENLEASILEIKCHIKNHFTGSVFELEELLKEWKEKSNDSLVKVSKLEKDGSVLDAELSKAALYQNQLLVQEGKYQQEVIANEERLLKIHSINDELVPILKRVKVESEGYSFSESFETSVNIECSQDLTASVMVKALASAIRFQESKMATLNKEYRIKENDQKTVIDNYRAELTSMVKEMELKNTVMDKNRKSCLELQRKLAALETSHDNLAKLDENEEEYTEKIAEIKDSRVIEKCDEELDELSSQIDSLQDRVEDLQVNHLVLVKDEAKLEKIKMLQVQKTQKETEYNDMLKGVEDILLHILGEIPKESIANKIENKSKAMDKELKSKKSEQKSLENDLIRLESNLKQMCKDKEKAKQRLQYCEEQIEDVMEGQSDYEIYFNNTILELEDAQSSDAHNTAAKFLYKKFVQKLRKKDCCPLCKRDFKIRNEVEKLAKELESDVEKMEEDASQEKLRIETLKKKRDAIFNIKPAWEEASNLKQKEIPDLESKTMEIQTKISNLKVELECVTSSVDVLEHDAQLCKDAMQKLYPMTLSQTEVPKLQVQIDKIEASREKEAKVMQLSLAEVQKKLQEDEGELKLKRSLKVKKEKFRTTSISDLTKFEQLKNRTVAEKLKITAELKNREAFEEQKRELEASCRSLNTEIKTLNGNIPNIKISIQSAEMAMQELTSRKEEAVHTIAIQKQTLEGRKQSLIELNKGVEDFASKKERYRELQKKCKENKNKMVVIECKRTENTAELNEVKKQISNQEVRLRELEDNKAVRLKEEAKFKLEQELKQTEKLIQETKFKGLIKERTSLIEQSNNLHSKFNQLTGKITEKKLQVRELKNELKQAHLKDAESRYSNCFIEKAVFDKTKKDICRYKAALDHAIMMFHSKQMRLINEYLHDYWSRIYTGNDIETIMIKTDNDNLDEDSGEPKRLKINVGVKSRKTYNYRVVMVRRGMELDMRGRCSAGQRILAALIIRIAISMAFKSSCGIIALDEPTTNLDQANINSLAEALHNVAERAQKRQRSFQLIVITHDLEFLNRLMSLDPVESYYKVKRDRKGFSQITRVEKRTGGL